MTLESSRSINPIYNVNDYEINERLFIFSSLISIITGKNLKPSNILFILINDKICLKFLCKILEIDDEKEALLEFIKHSEKLKTPVDNLHGNRRKRKRNL